MAANPRGALPPLASTPWHGDEVETVEIDLLLEALYRRYGYDFRQYARSSLRRRLWRRAREEGLATLSALLDRMLHDPECSARLMADLSVNVTEMFRDPSFFLTFRTKVVPLLRTYPFIRIWNAGCASGEETYSVAIVLHEEGLYERSRIYATDMSEGVLDHARAGTVPTNRMRQYTKNYLAAGGTSEFSGYYRADATIAQIEPSLRRNVVFAQHNLVSDRSFNEFNVIFCRNVMIYFDKDLQAHVHGLLYDSLVRFGVLALGQKESIRFTRYEDRYAEVDGDEKLYRKVR